MLITDRGGRNLRLGKTRLSEIDWAGFSYFTVNLVDLTRAAAKTHSVYIRERRRGKKTGWNLLVTYSPRERRIGCRVFDRKNWALIRTAVKAAKETQ